MSLENGANAAHISQQEFFANDFNSVKVHPDTSSTFKEDPDDKNLVCYLLHILTKRSCSENSCE